MNTHAKSKTDVYKTVHIENELRKVSRPIIEKVLEILRPYIGQKIVKADGSTLIKKLSDQLRGVTDFMPDDPAAPKIAPVHKGHFARMHYCTVKASGSSLWLNIALNFNGGSYEAKDYYCDYKEGGFYLGDLSTHWTASDPPAGVLVKLKEDYVKNYDFTPIDPAVEYENHLAAKAAAETFENLNGALLPDNRFK